MHTERSWYELGIPDEESMALGTFVITGCVPCRDPGSFTDGVVTGVTVP